MKKKRGEDKRKRKNKKKKRKSMDAIMILYGLYGWL